MYNLFDSIGSWIIGGILIVMILSLNLQMADVSTGTFTNNFVQKNSLTTIEILENDFYKMGYRNTSGEDVTFVRPWRIYFMGDIDNDGTVNEIRYYVSAKTAMSSTENPNDRVLYRKIDTQPAETIGTTTWFNMEFYDGNDVRLNDDSLFVSASWRSMIRKIYIRLKFESPEQVHSQSNSNYQRVQWNRQIEPVNLAL